MGKQSRLKQMRREMRDAEIRNPPPMQQKAREKRYVDLAQAIQMFPEKDKMELAVLFVRVKHAGYPGIPVWVEVPVDVSHKRNMKKAFLRDGWNGIEGYMEETQFILNENKKVAFEEAMTKGLCVEAAPIPDGKIKQSIELEASVQLAMADEENATHQQQTEITAI